MLNSGIGKIRLLRQLAERATRDTIGIGGQRSRLVNASERAKSVFAAQEDRPVASAYPEI